MTGINKWIRYGCTIGIGKRVIAQFRFSKDRYLRGSEVLGDQLTECLQLRASFTQTGDPLPVVGRLGPPPPERQLSPIELDVFMMNSSPVPPGTDSPAAYAAHSLRGMG